MTIPAHCCILWSRLPGLRSHIEKAYHLRGKKPYVIMIENDAEMNAVFAFLDDEEFRLETEEEKLARVTAAATDDGNTESKDEGKDGKFREHEWDPSSCISVPGTVYGVGYRCTCAHGAFAQAVGKTQVQADENKEGGGFTTIFQIVGVMPSVLRKVVEIMYGYDMPHVFESKEVLDCILLARFFHFEDLLVMLYRQGYFPEWGCALWDSGRIINDELGRRWFVELLEHADRHLEKEAFAHDGGRTLTHAGVKILLAHDDLNCEEALVFDAMMTWAKYRAGRIGVRKDSEESKITQQEARVSEEATNDAGSKTRLSQDQKMQILKKKRAALHDRTPSLKTIGGGKDGLAVLVRYPFITPELLNYSIAQNPEFQQMMPIDNNGLPLVLRAVFHQDGQRMPGWDTNLHWTPRQGSINYSGEWEWIFGPAAMTQAHDGHHDWPVQAQYFGLDFPFATDKEIDDLNLTKLEVFNLDKDGDGEPRLYDMLITFRSCFEEAESTRGTFFETIARRIENGTQQTNDEEKVKTAHKIALGTKSIRYEGAAELKKIMCEVCGKGLTPAAKPSDVVQQRKIFAVGRIRPSKLNTTNAEVGRFGGKLRDRSDQRLYGRAFLIVDDRKQAREIKKRFEGKPFHIMSHVRDTTFKWEALKSEVGLHFDIADLPEGKEVEGAMEVTITIVCCNNLPKEDMLFNKIDAYVSLSHEGYVFQTEVVKNDYDPVFNPKTATFIFQIFDVEDPGQIDIRVR